MAREYPDRPVVGIGGVVIAAILGLFLEPLGALLNANIYRKLGQEPIAPVEA